MEVRTVVSLSSVQQLTAEQHADIQFRVVVVIMEVFKVFTQDKVRSALLSRSLTFLLVEVLKIFSLILGWQPHPQFRVPACR